MEPKIILFKLGPMKYGQLINKMPSQKIKELYYSCNLVANGRPIYGVTYTSYI
jgi:hypothetical protein